MDQPRVAAVEALTGTLSVAVTWIDGTRDVVDLSEPIRRFTMLRPLADPALFAKVKVAAWGWAIGWGDAEDPDIDYPADRLWQHAQDQRCAAA
ncbi:DUF2442 domain-containing protein (plasmid) [Azospirillum oryzae]|uniref:DUF2442 domain-containing protein n=1 Tax=Azospirillum oryzae TaxID=286727 RepID=A0A6N1AVN6_9PROT|nr:DUF2442 domain-containing protein [Azospirillum oryzae]KAA0584897.1 DUF2442 domain-containing protein [Azospirillum oryzae]QKS54377.1 DUF2442 domain-containing protein [Azospirillum oryzae]GLR78961.1 hypothetical protein GCM10007856_16350 [Azospirillum oryzae]